MKKIVIGVFLGLLNSFTPVFAENICHKNLQENVNNVAENPMRLILKDQ